MFGCFCNDVFDLKVLPMDMDKNPLVSDYIFSYGAI